MPKLSTVLSLHGDNSNHVNPNQVISIKRQRPGNKIYVKRIVKETKTLIDIQDNVGQPDKAKIIAHREMLSTKIQLINSYDKQILDSIDTNADMEREIFESSEFERSVSELIISINMWLKSHENEVMSDGTVPYPIQNSNSQNSDISVRPRFQDKKFRLFPVILYNFKGYHQRCVIISYRVFIGLWRENRLWKWEMLFAQLFRHYVIY